jgi:cell division protein FtsL
MTFIQPQKHLNIQNFVIAMLVVLVLVGTFWVVVGYNKTVDLSHNIISAKTKLDSVGAQNTVLNNDIVATLGGGRIGALAAADSLVQDNKPQYFSINQQWPIASQ